MNFLVSHTCKKRFNDVIGQSTAHVCIPTQKIQNMADLHGEITTFWNLIFLSNWLD